MIFKENQSEEYYRNLLNQDKLTPSLTIEQKLYILEKGYCHYMFNLKEFGFEVLDYIQENYNKPNCNGINLKGYLIGDCPTFVYLYAKHILGERWREKDELIGKGSMFGRDNISNKWGLIEDYIKFLSDDEAFEFIDDYIIDVIDYYPTSYKCMVNGKNRIIYIPRSSKIEKYLLNRSSPDNFPNWPKDPGTLLLEYLRSLKHSDAVEFLTQYVEKYEYVWIKSWNGLIMGLKSINRKRLADVLDDLSVQKWNDAGCPRFAEDYY